MGKARSSQRESGVKENSQDTTGKIKRKIKGKEGTFGGGRTESKGGGDK